MGQFEKGQSGNPGGRPKGAKGFAALARETTDDGRALILFWHSVMEDPEAEYQHRLKASQLLAERGFGRPLQEVEIGGADGGPVKHEHTHKLTFADVADLAASLTANGSR